MLLVRRFIYEFEIIRHEQTTDSSLSRSRRKNETLQNTHGICRVSARINIAGQNTQRTRVKGRGNKSSRRRLHDGRAKPKLKRFCETAYLFSRGVRTRANKYALPVLYPFTRYSSALPFSFDRAVRFFYDLLFVLRSPNFFLSLFSRLCVFSSVWNDPPQRTDENAASGRRERMRKPCDRENVCPSLDRKVKTRDLGSRVPSKRLGLLDKFSVCTWVRVCTCIERATSRIFDVFPRVSSTNNRSVRVFKIVL